MKNSLTAYTIILASSIFSYISYAKSENGDRNFKNLICSNSQGHFNSTLTLSYEEAKDLYNLHYQTKVYHPSPDIPGFPIEIHDYYISSLECVGSSPGLLQCFNSKVDKFSIEYVERTFVSKFSEEPGLPATSKYFEVEFYSLAPAQNGMAREKEFSERLFYVASDSPSTSETMFYGECEVDGVPLSSINK